MKQRGLRPLSDLAADRPHGERLRYLAGCRCLPCRAANSQYECQRAAARKAGDWNGLVSAKRARRHIQRLSAKGVGRKALAEASDVGRTCIVEIRSGKKTQIRKQTERKLLAVTAEAVSGGAIIDASRTWQLINRLLEEGFTRADLAKRLGRKTPVLQIRKDRVRAKTAADVLRLYNKLMN